MKGSKGHLEIEGQTQVCKSIPRNYLQHLKFKANWHIEVKVKISEHSDDRVNTFGLIKGVSDTIFGMIIIKSL